MRCIDDRVSDDNRGFPVKSALLYGVQAFVVTFLAHLAFDSVVGDGIVWSDAIGLSACVGIAFGLIHALGWAPKKV